VAVHLSLYKKFNVAVYGPPRPTCRNIAVVQRFNECVKSAWVPLPYEPRGLGFASPYVDMEGG